jgi:hypothetical protein
MAAMILPLFFLLGIGLTILTGQWQTESSKVPAKFKDGELAGEYNPADIRGSYTLGDLEKAFGIPVATLAKAFGFSNNENLAQVKVKEFEELYGMIDDKEVGTDSMRFFIALFLNRPYTAEEDTALPQPAFNILKKETNLSEEVLSSIEKRVVSLLDTPHASPDSQNQDDNVLLEIKGKTLFSELLDQGLTEDQITDALGGIPMGEPSVSVRDFCADQGIEFSAVKSAIQELLDQQHSTPLGA